MWRALAVCRGRYTMTHPWPDPPQIPPTGPREAAPRRFCAPCRTAHYGWPCPKGELLGPCEHAERHEFDCDTVEDKMSACSCPAGVERHEFGDPS